MVLWQWCPSTAEPKSIHSEVPSIKTILSSQSLDITQSLPLCYCRLQQHDIETIAMNSSELAYQMRRISLDSNCESLPTPPHSLDCSGFDKFNSMSSFHSYESTACQSQLSSCSLSSNEYKGLSRSRCVANLSAMGSVSSEDTALSRSSTPQHVSSAPNARSWGYFVDSVESWASTDSNFVNIFFWHCHALRADLETNASSNDHFSAHMIIYSMLNCTRMIPQNRRFMRRIMDILERFRDSLCKFISSALQLCNNLTVKLL